MKSNKSQCSFLCNQNYSDIAFKNTLENMKPPYFCPVLSQDFFKCFCKKTCTSKKGLDMSSSTVYKKIKRPLEDVDIPALLIFLEKHQDITCVNLASNNVSDSGFMNLLDHLLLYKNIQELNVQNNNIMEKGINYLVEVAEDLEIKSLNLNGNKFGAQASQKVAQFLLKNKHLRYLNVAEVDQTASSLIYFIMVLSSEQEVSNTTLKSLDISRPNPGCMYHFDSLHFANIIGYMLKNNTDLAALHLQKYNFSCHDVESMISNAKYNYTLHLLDLGCNNIGDHGVDQLVNWLMKRPALKILILHSNIITDSGARGLSFALPFSKLLSLDISYNKITDEGITAILNTLKKSPLLQELRIFGNCIGYPTAKIIKRMLVSQVLNQENLDVRPYRVDHNWYIARYQGSCCKKEYYDVPYNLFFLPSVHKERIRPKRTYYKYVYSKSHEVKLQHSTMAITLGKECKCCYCLNCEALRCDTQCRNTDHPDTCTCCKCKRDESSDWSVDESIRDRVRSLPDPMKNIMYILERVNLKVQKNIERWINIDENILEEDLKVIADRNTVDEISSEDTVSCNCSWVQLNVSSLKKLLEEASLKNLFILPKNRSICSANSTCKNNKEEVFQLRYCSNTL